MVSTLELSLPSCPRSFYHFDSLSYMSQQNSLETPQGSNCSGLLTFLGNLVSVSSVLYLFRPEVWIKIYKS